MHGSVVSAIGTSHAARKLTMCPLKHNQRPKTENPMENHNETDIYSASWVDIIPTVIQIGIQEQITTFSTYIQKSMQQWKWHIWQNFVKPIECSWFDDFSTFKSNLSKWNQYGRKILMNFSQICQNKISSADLTILTNFRPFSYCKHFWTYQGFTLIHEIPGAKQM